MSDAERVQELLGLLDEVHDVLLRFEDVEDGSYGEPRPNWAMRLLNDIREAKARTGCDGVRVEVVAVPGVSA